MNAAAGSIEGLKELIVVGGWMEAEIIKCRLESFEIPASLQYETAGRLFGITMNGLGKVAVLVPRERWAEARAILEENAPAATDDGD